MFTLAGAGGADIGSFNGSANFPSSFTVTNLDSITVVDRAQPLTLNWTGTGVDFLTVVITNFERIGPDIHIATVTCYVPAGPGTFTIPVSVLSHLLATAAPVALSVQGYTFALFPANLAAGGQIDFGSVAAGLHVSKNLPIR